MSKGMQILRYVSGVFVEGGNMYIKPTCFGEKESFPPQMRWLDVRVATFNAHL